jgi:hypothetical protein
MSSKLALIKKQLAEAKNVTRVQIDLPYNLKDDAKAKFGVSLLFDGDTQTWNCLDEDSHQFEKTYLEEFKNPTADQKALLKEQGANYDKEKKMYFFLKFQLDDEE